MYVPDVQSNFAFCIFKLCLLYEKNWHTVLRNVHHSAVSYSLNWWTNDQKLESYFGFKPYGSWNTKLWLVWASYQTWLTRIFLGCSNCVQDLKLCRACASWILKKFWLSLDRQLAGPTFKNHGREGCSISMIPSHLIISNDTHLTCFHISNDVCLDFVCG